jgi:hypothetical protein
MAHLWLIPASKMTKTVQLVTRNYQNFYNRFARKATIGQA